MEIYHVARLDLILLSMVDNSYTLFYRECLETNGEVFMPLWSESEIDALLDSGLNGGGMTNPDLPTKLTQAAFERQTGIKVDLSTAGPVSLSLSKANEESKKLQTHNTITIVKSDLVVKKTSTERLLIKPIYTPEDYNVPLKSLDWAQRLPQTTPLDKISIDERENPVERSLMNALAALQCLESMGADVSELVEWLGQHWGISFIAEILEKVGLASADDMSTYIATGGRPPPQIYLSSNVTSQYRPQSKPTVDVEMLPNISTFMGRFIMTAKFISLVHASVHGIEAPHTWYFHCNDSQLSEVTKSTFVGTKFRVGTRASLNPLASQIVHKDTFNDFIHNRMASRHLDRSDQLTVFKQARKLLSTLPESSNYNTLSKKTHIFSNLVPKSVIGGRGVSHNLHSKVTSMFLAYNSDGRRGDAILDHYSICCTLLSIMFVEPSNDNLTRIISKSTSVGSIRMLRKHINSAEARLNIKELDQLCQNTDPGPMVFYYLYSRYLTLSRPTIISLRDFMCEEDKSIEKYYGTDLGQRNVKLALDYLCGNVKNVKGIGSELRPFTYLRISSGSFSHSKYALSLFSVGLREILEGEISLRGEIKENGITDGALQKSLTSIIFKKTRTSWTSFYEEKAASCRNSINLIEFLSDEDVEMVKRKNNMKSWFEIEYGHYVAIILAYKFYNIKISSKIEIEDSNLKSYTNYLKAHTLVECLDAIEVDAQEHRFAQKNSALRGSFNKYVLELTKSDNMAEKIKTHYSSNIVKSTVMRSLKELVSADHALVWDELPHKVVPMIVSEDVKVNSLSKIANSLVKMLGDTIVKPKDPTPNWASQMSSFSSICGNQLRDYPQLSSMLFDIADNIGKSAKLFDSGEAKALAQSVGSSLKLAASFSDPDDVRSFFDKDLVNQCIKLIERMYANGKSTNVFE